MMHAAPRPLVTPALLLRAAVGLTPVWNGVTDLLAAHEGTPKIVLGDPLQESSWTEGDMARAI
jgi:hypothetical protein